VSRLAQRCSYGWPLVVMVVLAGCGEPVFENAGSQNSLLEDREACAMEMEKSPAAINVPREPHGASGICEPGIYRYEPLHRTQGLEASEVSARARAGA
jgi:hypothetical protein